MVRGFSLVSVRALGGVHAVLCLSIAVCLWSTALQSNGDQNTASLIPSGSSATLHAETESPLACCERTLTEIVNELVVDGSVAGVGAEFRDGSRCGKLVDILTQPSLCTDAELATAFCNVVKGYFSSTAPVVGEEDVRVSAMSIVAVELCTVARRGPAFLSSALLSALHTYIIDALNTGGLAWLPYAELLSSVINSCIVRGVALSTTHLDLVDALRDGVWECSRTSPAVTSTIASVAVHIANALSPHCRGDQHSPILSTLVAAMLAVPCVDTVSHRTVPPDRLPAQLDHLLQGVVSHIAPDTFSVIWPAVSTASTSASNAALPVYQRCLKTIAPLLGSCWVYDNVLCKQLWPLLSKPELLPSQRSSLIRLIGIMRRVACMLACTV